jgi:hypothetical protein
MKKHATTYSLTDDMVATLEAFLPGENSADLEARALNGMIADTLDLLERRLAISSRTPQSPEQFKALSAARQAVQGGVLAWQLHQAGKQRRQTTE